MMPFASSTSASSHGRSDDVAEVARGIERVHANPVAELARQATVGAIHGRHVDGDAVDSRDRSRIEERIAEGELVVLAREAWRRSGSEVLEYRAQAQHVLAQAGSRRRGPGRGVAALVVGLHLGAETQHEPAPAEALQIPGELGRHEGAARKCDRDARPDAGPPRVLGQRHGGQEGIVAGLGHQDGVVPDLVESPPVGDQVRQALRRGEGCLDLHRMDRRRGQLRWAADSAGGQATTRVR
jgi:hypothetical protein